MVVATRRNSSDEKIAVLAYAVNSLSVSALARNASRIINGSKLNCSPAG